MQVRVKKPALVRNENKKLFFQQSIISLKFQENQQVTKSRQIQTTSLQEPKFLNYL